MDLEFTHGGVTQLSAGLLGAKVDPRFSDNNSILNARLEEVERRILAIESKLEALTSD